MSPTAGTALRLVFKRGVYSTRNVSKTVAQKRLASHRERVVILRDARPQCQVEQKSPKQITSLFTFASLRHDANKRQASASIL